MNKLERKIKELTAINEDLPKRFIEERIMYERTLQYKICTL